MKYLSTAVLLACSGCCQAANDFWLDIPLTSKHFEDTYQDLNSDRPFNSNNLGMGLSVKMDTHLDFGVGTYMNSYYDRTNYLALDYHTLTTNRYRLGVTVGVFTGYDRTRIMLIPNISVISYGYKLTIGVIPSTQGAVTASFGIQF